jgi:hypothetical protein
LDFLSSTEKTEKSKTKKVPQLCLFVTFALSVDNELFFHFDIDSSVTQRLLTVNPPQTMHKPTHGTIKEQSKESLQNTKKNVRDSHLHGVLFRQRR